MIRFLNAYFPARTVLLGASEGLLAAIAFVAATVAAMGRLNAQLFLGYEQGGARVALIVAVFLLCMYYFDLYDSTVLRSQREIFTRLIQVFGTVCLILAFVYSLFPAMCLEQRVFILGGVAAAALTFAWRRLFVVVNTWPVFQERVLVLGEGKLAHLLLDELHKRPELGFLVVSHLTEDRDWGASLPPESSWISQELNRLTKGGRVQRIIVAMKERRGRLPAEPLLELKKRGVLVQDGSELYEVITGKLALDSLRPSMLLFSPGFQVSPTFLMFKRVFSMLLAGAGLLAMLPLMLLVAIAIKLDSPGPVIFRQKRVGKEGKIFTLYKFRSMVDGVDQDGNFQPAGKNDKRNTRVGRWLRASRLDEAPQLLNIFLGDMYFVGPRPFVPNQEEECVRNIPFYNQRWSVRPGATGWAQVNRGYCATIADNSEKLAYDLFYIKNMSIGLDLLIVFKTLKTLLLGRGGR